MDNFSNTELGTHRNHRTAAALEATHVRLDDSSPMDLVDEAIALARELRFVAADGRGNADWASILQASKSDWSGFLGDINGEVYAEFKRFFGAPTEYIASKNSPLGQPHVALFAAFIHILKYAQAALNGFTQRHLDHYITTELALRPLPAQPAEAFVTFKLKAGSGATILPEGSLLRAPSVDETLAFATEGALEVHQGSLSQISSLRVQFAPAGLRAALKPAANDGGMAAIRAQVWASGYDTRIPTSVGTSFEGFLDQLSNRDNRRNFPADVLQVSIEEFRQMMALAPRRLPMTAAEEEIFQKWEALWARMVICRTYPQPHDALPSRNDELIHKLSIMLFNGTALPFYKGQPLDLFTLYRDANQLQSLGAATAALAYLHEVLFLEESDFRHLYDLGARTKDLPKSPPALIEAMIAKAATLEPKLLRNRATSLQAAAVASKNDRSPLGNSGGWFPYGLANGDGRNLQGLGLLIESPLLAMAEGDRKITLTLDFAPHDFATLRSLFDLSAPMPRDWYAPFVFYISTVSNWLSLDWRTTAPKFFPSTRQIEFTLDIPATLPSIAGPGAKFPDALLVGKGPLLNLRLAPPKVPAFPAMQVPHDLFCQALSLLRLQLKVTVEGLREFQAENQEGGINTTAPFEPFGSAPGPNAEFRIAHPEICLKPLQYLDLKLEWMNMPASLKEYYDPYFAEMGNQPAIAGKAHDKADFKAALQLVRGRWTHPLGTSDLPFWESTLHVGNLDLPRPDPGYDADAIATWESPSEWPRYFRLVYNMDWDPQLEYARATRRLGQAMALASNSYAAASVAYTTAPTALTEGKTNAERFAIASAQMANVSRILLQPPVVPKLKRMTIGYSAQVDIPLVEWAPEIQRAEKLFHQLPFGHRALPIGNGTSQPLLPHFEAQGNVMLGFEGIDGTEALSLLVKVQAGSGNPDTYPPAVTWSYFGQTGWRQLPTHHILLDETNGLLQTGLLRLTLPADAAPSLMEMPGQCYWVMASVADECEHLPDWENVHLHALRVRQVPRSATADNSWFCPQGSITALDQYFPTIEEVSQPYATVGGRAAESAIEFYRRVSERLRHKNRAVTAWDYEHLCLAQFPHLFAVKTIPAIAARDRKPGELSVVVVPDLRMQRFSDPFQPRFGYGELNEISSFLETRAPAFARIVARNPVYRPVVVGTTLNFKDGYSSAACIHRVQERLKEYLAPWAYDKSTEMAFGGRLYVSEIVDFLQSEPYVGFVGKTRLFVGDAEGSYAEATITDGDSSAYIEVASTDVLTSAQSHLVSEIGRDNAQNEIWEGISWMVIYNDFKVKVDPAKHDDVYEEFDGISWVVVGRDMKVK